MTSSQIASTEQQGEMKNWKNVNNWHWVEKNCIEWARKWLTENLIGIPSAELGSFKNVTVTSVSDIEGDADLNVRKGKVRYLYDLSLKFTVTGEKDGSPVEARVEVKEFTFDEEPPAFDYSFSGSDSAFRSAVQKEYLKNVYAVFVNFPKELVAQNGSQILVEPSPVSSQEKLSVPQNANTLTGSQSSSKPLEKAKKPENVKTTRIDLKSKFKCSPEDLFNALTVPQRISAWSQGPAKFVLSKGEAFELFHGNVTGSVKDFVQNESMTLTWRLKSWAEGVVSDVVFIIDNLEDHVQLRIEQSGIPVSEKESLPTAWEQMYFERIKHVFGYLL